MPFISVEPDRRSSPRHSMRCTMLPLALMVSVWCVSVPAHAGVPVLCGNGISWASATFVSMYSEASNTSVRIQRYTNAVRIDIDNAGAEKSLIELEKGEQFFRGAVHGPRDFMFADLATSAPLHILQKKFATPCDAFLASTFELTPGKNDGWGRSADRVTGTIEGERDSVRYTLDFYANGVRQPEKRVVGRWAATAINAIPPKTDIRGWALQRGDGNTPEKMAPTTIQEWYELRGSTR